MLERIGRGAGVDHCHPHTFRRTFALWSLRNGMSINGWQAARTCRCPTPY
jgi:integrase